MRQYDEQPDISVLVSQFNNAASADSYNMNRCIRNTLAVAAVDGSSYSAADRTELLADGADISEYSYLQKYVRGIAGSFISNWFDPKFAASEDGSISPDTITKLTEVYMSSKDKGSYKASVTQCITDGCIYRGVEEIVIERPERSNPQTWYIRFKPVRADSIIFDPSNNENRISRNSKRCWRFSHPTVEEIALTYPDKLDEIERYFYKRYGADSNSHQQYDSNHGMIDSPLNPYDNHRDDKVKVVEYYHIEVKEEKRITYIQTDEDIPLHGARYGTPEAERLIKLWFLANDYEYDKRDVLSYTDTKPVLMVTVFVPEFNIVLDHGEDERQLGANLPFYAWSWMEINGRSVGVVDALWSAQRDLQKREAAKTKHLEKAAVSKTWYLPEAFSGDKDKERDFVNNLNDPSKPIPLGEDVQAGMAERVIGQIRADQISPVIMADENFKISMMNEISGLTPAMQGLTERSGESGSHYTRKVIEGSIQQKVPQEMLIQHEKDKAEDWLKLCPKVYSGPANYNRKIRKSGDSNEFVEINRLVGYGDDGSPILEDDLSNVSRVDVTIGKAPESDLIKQARRETDVSVLQYMQPTQTNAELIAMVQGNLVMNLDYATEQQKKEAEAAVERHKKLVKLQSEVQIRTLEGQLVSADVIKGTAAIERSLLPEMEEIKAKEKEVQYDNLVMTEAQINSQMNQLSNPQAQMEPGVATGESQQVEPQTQQGNAGQSQMMMA